ncbi:hypothetical protein N431DRAFT_347795 [Stipitochalara longipes BDJ]|nr:hypothetical protein N431DRAFT_347795 [Stipitochalara longipes BDJ]
MARLRLPQFQRKWKWPKLLIALMVLELAGTVPALALFGIASPNLYRTKLWQIGSDNGFNSSPLQILYAYANYRPIPKTPFVWSQELTDFNVAVSVLSMFVLLVKCSMFILHIWYPILSTLVNFPIVVLWAVSTYGQMGPDHSDPKHPANIAWYITKSCSYARPTNNVGYCLQAKGAFAVTVVMLATFFLNLILGIYSLIPTAEQRAASKIGLDDMQTKHSPLSDNSDREWEMKRVLPTHATPATPYTPRTLAFNTLDRQLPLRAQQGNSDKGRWN